MALGFRQHDPARDGTLEIEEVHPNFVEVYFVPPEHSLLAADLEKRDRPVPFENMVFIGDGSTDIPCFRLVKEQGGLSVAVFKPHTKGARGKADKYIKDGRVHCVAPAIYTDGSELDRVIKANINAVAARSALSGLFSEGAQ